MRSPGMKEKKGSSGGEESRTQPDRNREAEYTERATTFKGTDKLTREIYERLDKGDLVV